jgi:hypothetical protein
MAFPAARLIKAGLPSPLRGSVMSADYVGLEMNLLRRTKPCLNSENEKAAPLTRDGLFHFW